MKLLISVASAAIAATCLFTTGALANPAREPVAVHVSFAGLDLTSATGRKAFQHRMASAISNACAPRYPGLMGLADSQQCRREMKADASIQLAKVLGRDGTQLASIGVSR